ncbi:S41 family peptidase [Calidifontibacter sp. DB0510]|uniref:S41 family peptidase n=1 Tax=Metallococcus carri TaxID=1656884 RepID=A0A967B1G1_9MICO|nr:S41 family peptidase [Metallococcus carri]NHN55655.1 S41 family peptidase [Metallococcus carri]NOP38161.1 S41 family peptidase [Calidifontibacter sp. DB2511S]
MSIAQRFADLVAEHYVLADLAPGYADAIRGVATRVDAALPDLAAANEVIRSVAPDGHLGIRHLPRESADPTGAFAVTWTGPTAILSIAPVFPDDEAAVRSAAAEVAGAERLIIDLRACGGGDTDVVAALEGHLLGATPVLVGRFEKRDAAPVEQWISPADPQLTMPVSVLTSHRTFSGGEDLAYVLQAAGRAIVVGEVTGGGAHPVDHFPLDDGLVAQIPTGRFVSVFTGINWEGVGVQPDIPCSAELALDTALRSF